ncbi:MAG: hypothetical protein HOP08_00550 [Cyclobacteriaceae bacterium]|nr:hypothetical protein [Cyclobacteriaceae bacterium]
MLKVLVYATFKGHTKVVNDAFSFNQPGDSNASWGNKEIVPDSLAEILNFLGGYTIESELLRYWEGHHGIQPYLDCVFIKIFYEYDPRQKYFDENPAQITKEFCKARLDNDSSSVTALQAEIQELKRKLNFYIENNSPYIEQYFPNKGKIEATNNLFDTINNACQELLGDIQEHSTIRQETKDRFFTDSIAQYNRINYIFKLFRLYTHPTDEEQENPQLVYPGVNELFDRMAFTENWHIPYFGLMETSGTRVAELENTYGLGIIKRLAVTHQQEQIEESSIAEHIRAAKLKNKIVIGSNLYFDSIFRDDENFVSAWVPGENNIIPDFYVGRLGDTKIFNLYDKVFSNQLMIILSSDDIVGVIDQTANASETFKQIESFSCKFVDFGIDTESRNTFLADSPEWLLRQIPDGNGREKFIKSQVWIQMLKKVQFKVSKKRTALFYMIKD